MNLSAPKMTTFLISLVLVLVGILAFLVPIAAISPYALWVIVVGYVVLVIGVAAEGM